MKLRCNGIRLKIKRFLVYNIFLLLLCACGSKDSEINRDPSYIYLESLVERNIIKDNISEIQFLKLETTDDCLIQDINKIEFDVNKIFIMDSNEKIFVFDQNGNYLNRIGEVGVGPDEQLNMYDFYLDKNKQTVGVLDIYKSIMFEYSYTGELLEKKKFDSVIFDNTSHFYLLNEKNLLLVQDNQDASLFNYRVLNMKNGKYQDHLPYMATGNMSLAFGISKVAQTGGDTYMSAFLSDTIYQYEHKSNGIVPCWIFKGKLKAATKADFEENTYEMALEAMQTARSKKLSLGIDNLYSTNKYLYFTFNTNEGNYRAFFNRQEGGGYFYKIVPDNLLMFFGGLKATTEEAFVCALPVFELLEANIEDLPNLEHVLEGSAEDDNPILAFYYLN